MGIRSHQHDRLGGPGAVEVVELLEMGHKVGAALGRADMDDELAHDVIERAQHRHLLGLSWRRDRKSAPDFAQARAR